MAQRGTSKFYSVDQEEYVARTYGGTRSKSSGGAAHDYGDVRTPHSELKAGQLIECKFTEKPPKSMLRELEKVAKEAFAEGREPMLALRWLAPDSVLADAHGYVDLSVRRMCDDIYRHETAYAEGRLEGIRDETIARADNGE